MMPTKTVIENLFHKERFFINLLLVTITQIKLSKKLLSVQSLYSIKK